MTEIWFMPNKLNFQALIDEEDHLFVISMEFISHIEEISFG